MGIDIGLKGKQINNMSNAIRSVYYEMKTRFVGRISGNVEEAPHDEDVNPIIDEKQNIEVIDMPSLKAGEGVDECTLDKDGMHYNGFKGNLEATGDGIHNNCEVHSNLHCDVLSRCCYEDISSNDCSEDADNML